MSSPSLTDIVTELRYAADRACFDAAQVAHVAAKIGLSQATLDRALAQARHRAECLGEAYRVMSAALTKVEKRTLAAG